MEKQLFAPTKYEVIYDVDHPAPKFIKDNNDVDKILGFFGILYDRPFKEDFGRVYVDRDTLEMTVNQNNELISHRGTRLLRENKIELPSGIEITEYDAFVWLRSILENISDRSEVYLKWF